MPFRSRPLVAALAALLGVAALPALAQTRLPPVEPPAASVKPAPSEPVEGLSAEILYRILLGDVALQRGETALAARAYLDAARESSDARLARRAAEIALASRQRSLAEQSARLWAKLDPAAERPKQILAALAAGTSTGDVADDADQGDLKQRLERFLADAAVSGAGVGEPFLQLNRLFAQQSDKVAVYRLVRDLAVPYASSPEAQFAVALAGYNTGLTDAAILKSSLEATERALTLRPKWDRAALLKAEILAKQSPSAAIDWLVEFVKLAPEAKSAKTALAQHYIAQHRYADARVIYQSLWDEDHSQREYQFAVAVLAMQVKDWPAAEAELQDLKRAGFGESGVVESYLAQVAEEQKRYDEAIARYRAVPEGERAWNAKLRIAALLAKQGKQDEARRWLADLPAVTIEQRIQVRQAEAQLLREAGDNAGAYDVLGKALGEHPDSTDLLYDRAMVAEKLGRIDEAESTLRRVVELKPDDAHALNALGYTLVDRTPRVDEGYVLIQKAHALSPADPFILDSMGWALYRLGRTDDAVTYLQRAFDARPDPEIGAHLGEVLWSKGEAAKAREVWQSQLKLAPDNALLLETVRRLER